MILIAKHAIHSSPSPIRCIDKTFPNTGGTQLRYRFWSTTSLHSESRSRVPRADSEARRLPNPHSNAHHSTKQPSPGWLPAHCCHLPRSKRLRAPLEPLSTRKKAVTSRRHFSKNLSGAQCRQTSPTDTHTSAWQDLALLLTCGCGRMPER